jgi:hypothetical protein
MVGLNQLFLVLQNTNMSIFEFEYDTNSFDSELVSAISNQINFNKDLQLKLIPEKISAYSNAYKVEFKHLCKPCFKAAIKAWRIMKPQIINLSNENLDDDNIDDLSEFLKNQNHVMQLSLKRNNIQDRGAKKLAEVIKLNLSRLNNLELTRNKITEDGAKEIYSALIKNTRIRECLLNFGNKVPEKLMRQIEEEINANIKINAYVKPSLGKDTKEYGKLEFRDKGPEFLRCAIKSVLLLDIKELDMSDNLLGD